MTVLVDSVNLYNFLNTKLVQNLKFSLQDTSSLKVLVANGDHMKCMGRCVGVRLELPNYSTTSDFFVIQLEVLEVVLGIRRLKTLGSIF